VAGVTLAAAAQTVDLPRRKAGLAGSAARWAAQQFIRWRLSLGRRSRFVR